MSRWLDFAWRVSGRHSVRPARFGETINLENRNEINVPAIGDRPSQPRRTDLAKRIPAKNSKEIKPRPSK
jgi:hypothetical protein